MQKVILLYNLKYKMCNINYNVVTCSMYWNHLWELGSCTHHYDTKLWSRVYGKIIAIKIWPWERKGGKSCTTSVLLFYLYKISNFGVLG